ncbi:MAG: phosphatidate cytidylyltransferase [Bacillota bacterium]
MRETVVKNCDGLLVRVASALVGIPVFIMAAWWGQWPLFLLVAALYFTGIREMLRLAAGTGLKPSFSLAYAGGFVLLAAAYYDSASYPAALVCFLLICAVALVFLFPRYTLPEAGVTFFTTAYLSFFLYLYLLRLLPHGGQWLLLALVATWAFDIVAYFGGRFLGKRRLAPVLSPGKTLVGFISGLLGSAVASSLFSFWLPFDRVFLFGLGLVVGVAGQVGDLVFSAVKRTTGNKDTGCLIPGHGGVLDRFDSMLLTAPVVYMAARWLMSVG